MRKRISKTSTRHMEGNTSGHEYQEGKVKGDHTNEHGCHYIACQGLRGGKS